MNGNAATQLAPGSRRTIRQHSKTCEVGCRRTLIRRYGLGTDPSGAGNEAAVYGNRDTAAKRRCGCSWRRSNPCLHRSRQQPNAE
jgi:hypothetical protein